MVTLAQYPNMGWPKKVKFLKDVKEVKAGTVKEILIQKMIGTVYEPGYRDEEGKYHFSSDTVGKPDNRYAVMGRFVYTLDVSGKFTGYMDEFYKVFSPEELQETFEEIDELSTNVD